MGGVYDHDDEGKPIHPSHAEVRAVTEREAERMLEMNDDQTRSAVTNYAQDFGNKAAAQLEKYCGVSTVHGEVEVLSKNLDRPGSLCERKLACEVDKHFQNSRTRRRHERQ